MATAIICECSPFHNGHQYLFRTARLLTGEENIAVMSGSFTQRGEVAVTDKFTRAGALIRGGADLVVELPTAFAVANAQRFAEGGVRIAKSFACVNTLAFGCETEDIGVLRTAANALRSERVNSLIAEKMQAGGYYPRALQSAVEKVYGADAAAAVSSPNNILAVEYIRALEGSGIAPLPIKRKGVSHDSGTPSGNYASASQIRAMLRKGEDVSMFVPEAPQKITCPERLDAAVLYRLRTMTAGELRLVPDVGEGLENRILEAAGHSGSVEELLQRVKTKRYTHARLRRIITCAFLGITEELQNTPADYARVLGMTDWGAGLLCSCRCEIVTSAAKSLRENGKIAPFLRLDIRAGDVAALAYDPVQPSGSDYCTRIVK